LSRRRTASAGDEEAASIDRDLADIQRRLKEGATGPQEKAERTEVMRRARLRLIALARSEGWLWRLMRPRDELVGGNVVRFRRRVR
jgi:hypothetical protein